jgi:hypothetical protein
MKLKIIESLQKRQEKMKGKKEEESGPIWNIKK